MTLRELWQLESKNELLALSLLVLGSGRPPVRFRPVSRGLEWSPGRGAAGICLQLVVGNACSVPYRTLVRVIEPRSNIWFASSEYGRQRDNSWTCSPAASDSRGIRAIEHESKEENFGVG